MAAGKWRKESEEKIIRAVTLSNLMNIYLDYRSNEYAHLSPECYCGGVAPAAAACGRRRSRRRYCACWIRRTRPGR